MFNKKSQASLEYLTTYAWAFIILTVVIGAIYYFGILDFQKYLPQKCVFSSQLKCTDYSVIMGGTGEVRLKVLNNIGEELKIFNIMIEDVEDQTMCTNTLISTDGGANYAAFAIDTTLWNKEAEIYLKFTGCSGDKYYIQNERLEATIVLQYYSTVTAAEIGALLTHETRGKISAIVGV